MRVRQPREHGKTKYYVVATSNNNGSIRRGGAGRRATDRPIDKKTHHLIAFPGLILYLASHIYISLPPHTPDLFD